MPQEQSEPVSYEPVFTVAGTYKDLQQVVRERAQRLQISRSVLDSATGLADGYSGKVLAEDFTKKLGHLSLYSMLEVLGLKLIVVDEREAIERSEMLLRRFGKRDESQCRWSNKSASRPKKSRSVKKRAA